MRNDIDKMFDELENKINFYIEKDVTKDSLFSIHELKEKLYRKEQECEESKQACIEVATKLRKTILAMNSVMQDAD